MAPKILVVDDDTVALDLLRYTLERAGHQVMLAERGDEALQRVVEWKPDLVILDIMMPLMDGYEVCRRLRDELGLRRMPVIMLTAKSQVEDKIRGFEVGADDYVTKPVVPAELVARVKAQLSRRRPQQRAQSHLVGLVGVGEGVGVSSLAVNVSLALQELEQPTILAELSPGPAAAWRQLGLAGSEALLDLLGQAGAGIDRESVGRCLVAHPSGLRLLPPPGGQSAGRRRLTAVQADRLLKSLQTLARFIVVDFGARLDETLDVALRRCRQVILVTGPDRPALERAAEVGARLERVGLRRDRLGVVVNGRDPAVDSLDAAQVESRLGLPVWGVIPPAAELRAAANDRAGPLLLAEPDSAAAGHYRQLAARILAL